MHIDMDCFFVSVGLRGRPELVGKAVAVTHARQGNTSRGAAEDAAASEIREQEVEQYRARMEKRVGGQAAPPSSWKLAGLEGSSSMSEVASCSYEARAKGVKNGMFLGPALQLCPDLVTIPYDFPAYEEVSRQLYDTVAAYTLDMQVRPELGLGEYVCLRQSAVTSCWWTSPHCVGTWLLLLWHS